MKNSNILLLLAGAGLVYYFYNKNKTVIDQAAKQLLINQSSPLGNDQAIAKADPNFLIKVGNIKKRLTPHTI
jgi:hypothetical protein